MNVKPGDFARVIDKSSPACGKTVLVLERSYSTLARIFGDPEWCVELLEPATTFSKSGMGPPVRQGAGGKACCFDRCLRRIDPPSDSEDLWLVAPIEGDKAEV